MSDYIYILESHLSPEQNRVVAEVQAATAQANFNVFLTGGAMRDMLAGFRIRDLDFVMEGNALKIAKVLCEGGAVALSTDETRKSVELLFPGGVTAELAMSRHEKAGRSGGRPQVTPATIQDDLRGRDFTANAIALSLNEASRGLLLDPLNGLADIGRRELRAVNAYGFYDDPSRLLRLVRLCARLEFTVEERTGMQVANAREAEVEKNIPAHALGEEIEAIGLEDNPGEVLRLLDEAGLLALFSPALTGAGLNAAGLAKLEKAYKLLPDDTPSRAARLGPFLAVLTEKLSHRERLAFVKATELPKAAVDAWQKLEARAKKLESALHSPRIRKPSQLYAIVAPAAPDEVLFLLCRSAFKLVQERLRNYYQKYLPSSLEITPEEWATVEGKPGTPKYVKARADFLAHYLDRRPPKPEPEVETEGEAAVPAVAPPVPQPGGGFRRTRQ